MPLNSSDTSSDSVRNDRGALVEEAVDKKEVACCFPICWLLAALLSAGCLLLSNLLVACCFPICWLLAVFQSAVCLLLSNLLVACCFPICWLLAAFRSAGCLLLFKLLVTCCLFIVAGCHCTKTHSFKLRFARLIKKKNNNNNKKKNNNKFIFLLLFLLLRRQGRSTVHDAPETARLFSFLQVLTVVFVSFAHGGNDVRCLRRK